jgi:UDP-N-acetylglucosamine diphosphorylase / glucose-1-phosphate thymidylyltransferase / UDP-N-acetylgalactosamine diphosphorylase / glucosamine-1-phosphate N-acetyltransferase / galactosamine-1-phosphate N-acetyltransferase
VKINFDDCTVKESLWPLTATRNAADIRVGILTIREKWEIIFSKAGYTQGFNESRANLLPTTNWVDLHGHFNDDTIPVVWTADDLKVLNHPADIFKYNDWAIRKDYRIITAGRKSQPLSSTNQVVSPENIFIEEGASVECSIINASTGPVYIGKNATIMEGCSIRGPLALCEGATLKMGAKVYGATTIGPYCSAGGEIKNVVMFGYSNKAHDGYLGDSVIGEWCNLGAGTTNSNIKNTAGEVKMWDNAAKDFTDVGIKAGLIMGDYSRAAINTSFNTGTVVGVCCNIFSEGFPPKLVKNFTWGNEKYELEKALKDIDNWKKLKGRSITEEEKNILQQLYNQSI